MNGQSLFTRDKRNCIGSIIIKAKHADQSEFDGMRV